MDASCAAAEVHANPCRARTRSDASAIAFLLRVRNSAAGISSPLAKYWRTTVEGE
jgi:hypothetical protein